jgi:hypothetical protein
VSARTGFIVRKRKDKGSFWTGSTGFTGWRDQSLFLEINGLDLEVQLLSIL